MKTVNVEIWSDFVCPWCWVAKRRLERAVERLDGQVQVVMTNKAYRLAKGMQPMDFGSALKVKFGNELSARQMMAAVAEPGTMEGLTYNFGTMRFGDTRDAHSLVKSMSSEPMRHSMIEALSQASITDGQNIFDREVLRSIASQVGLSDVQVAAIDFDRIREIENDEMRANAVSNGVPLFLFNDKVYISGAQSVDTFIAALNESAQAFSPTVDLVQVSSCDVGGCRS